jgi:type IV pilus assembly protein PilM
MAILLSFFNWFKAKQKSCLGIDLGSSGIKVAELVRKEKGRLFLTNYVIAQTRLESNFSIAKLEADQIASVLQDIFNRAGIKTKQAVISLSVGETFSTIIAVPSMKEDELVKAIPFQAKKYVPIPIEEVVLDWSVVGEYVQPVGAQTDSAASPAAGEENRKPEISDAPAGGVKMLQVLIVAVPQEVIRKIAQIAKRTNLKVLAVEQEAFSIIRSIIGKDEGSYLVIDLGQENVDLIVMDRSAIRLTCTFEKNKSLDLVAESAKVINSYQARYNRKIGRVILIGGWVTQFNWAETFGAKLGIPVGLGDPFARIAYDPKLGRALKEISPFMAVAVGGAMREI